MPKNYFYEDDEKRILREELLTTKAEQLGKNFSNSKMTKSQMRKFYHEVKSLEALQKSMDWKPTKPLVKMLKSKVAYASGRGGGSEKVPPQFKEFIFECIDNIEDDKDFAGFNLMFEAVMGFYYQYAKGR